MEQQRKTYAVPVRVTATPKSEMNAPKTFASPSSAKKVGVTTRKPIGPQDTLVSKEDWNIPVIKKKVTMPEIPWHRWFTKKNALRVSIACAAFIVATAGILTVLRFFTFTPDVARILPSQTLAFFSLNTDPWNTEVRDAARLLTKEGLSNMNQPENFVPEIDKDIIKNSHVRSVSIAFLPTDHGTLSRVLLLDIPRRKQEAVLEHFVPKATRRVTDYKGIDHFADTAAVADTLSQVVRYGNVVVISDDPSSLYLITDVMVHDAIALAKTEDFHDMASAYTQNPVLLGYVQSEKAKSLLSLLPPLSPWTTTLTDTLVREHPFVASVGVEKNDLTINIAAKSDGDVLEEASGSLLGEVPKNALVAVEGANLAEQTENIQKTLENSSPLFAFYFQNLERRLKDTFDFDIRSQLLSNFDGPFVVFIDSTKSRWKTTDKLFHDVGLVIELKDEKGFLAQEEEIQGKVQKVLAAQFRDNAVDFQDENVQDTTIHTLQSENIPIPLAYAVRDGKLIIGTSKDFVATMPTNSLIDVTKELQKQLPRKYVRTYYLGSLNEIFASLTHTDAASEIFGTMIVTEEQHEGMIEFNGRIPLSLE